MVIKLTTHGIEHIVKESKDLAGFKPPFTKAKQVRSFLGLVMWYKSFIPHVSTIAAPLFPLTSEKRKFEWTDKATQAVEALKKAILEAPVLAKFDRDLPTRVTTDASAVGIGAVMEQRHGSQWRPVAFWSRKLKDAETRYSATDIEWLAVVDAVTLTWRHMLEDIPFLIRSDHKALERKLMKSAHEPPLLPRQVRWIERLMPYSYTFEYIKGSENLVADALSRCPYMLNSVTVVHSMLAGLLARMKIAATQDIQYRQDVLDILRGRPTPGNSPLPNDTESPNRDTESPNRDTGSPIRDTGSPTRDTGSPIRDSRSPISDSGSPIRDPRSPIGDSESLIRNTDSILNPLPNNSPEHPPGSPLPLDLPRSEWPTSRFTKLDRLVQNDLIIYPNGVIVVPHDNEIRTLLLTEAHDSRMGGHFGIEKTLEKIKRFWTWAGVAHDVELYVQSCVSCQKTKHETARPKGLLYPLVASRPWQMVTMDFVGKFAPAAETSNNTCLVIVDKFSKYTILEGVPENIDAQRTAQIFIKRVVSVWGVPAVVISDRGPQFSSQLWRNILKSLGSHAALATSHHPQTDGQSERAVQTVLRLIRSYATEQQDQWEALLPMLEYALNDAYCKSTMTTPFRLLRGYDPVGPQQFMVGTDQEGNSFPRGSWERRWAESQENVWSFVQSRQREIAARMKERYDQHRKSLDLAPGDLVLLSTKSHHLLEGFRKQQERFVGPYVVKERVHPNAYRLLGLPTGVPTTQNVRFLIKFHRSPDRFASRPEPDSSAPELIDGQYEWEVEEIVDHRSTRTGMTYLVKWKGFSRKQWLLQEDMENSKDLLREYHQRRGLPLTPFLEQDSEGEEDSAPPAPGASTPLASSLDPTPSPTVAAPLHDPRERPTDASTPSPPTPLVPPPLPRRSPRFQPTSAPPS